MVLDFGVAGAAPEIGRLFAEYGADVIRVETPKRPDLFRQLGGPSGMSPVFASSSRTKRSLGVDFDSPAGVDVVRELVRKADLVVENLPPGTMDRYGLGPATMLELNPDVIVISSQTMGLKGPWREWRGYGANTQPPGGMTYLWSYPDAPEPVASNVAFPDHVVGRLGAFAAAAYLAGRPRDGHRGRRDRDRAGRGEHQPARRPVPPGGLEPGFGRTARQPLRPRRAVGCVPVRRRPTLVRDHLP